LRLLNTEGLVFRSILVPLDGSTLAEQALPLAAALAEWNRASLCLVAVHPWGPAEDMPRPGTSSDRALRKDEGVYLNRLVQAITSAYPVPVCEAVLDGRPGRMLAEFARERDIDLVVASSHGHGPLGRLKAGGLSGHLAHRLRAPVLFVKPHVGPVRMTAYGGFGRILVAVDGSPRAEAALDPAAGLAAKEGVVLALARVVASGQPRLSERRAEAGKYLASLVRRLQRRGRRVQTAVLVGDDPARAIVTYAEKEDMELIALTTRERGPVARTVFGSIADAALHKASVPVLICHAAPAGTTAPLTFSATGR
jgi:nucleotide-binding universal stress UspA family protein